MKIFNSLDEIENIEETVVALGNFDGVHKGHQQIISRTVKSAEAAGYKSAVFTFSNHPKNLMADKIVVKNILYADEKAKIIESLGVDYMFNIPFDRHILTMDPIDFIDGLLIDTFRMRQAYCGFNYRFGYKAAGNAEILMKEGMKKGFGIHIQEPYEIDGNLVSSTFIRNLIQEGRVDQCMKYMGRLYSIGGEVVVGNKLGRTIGFPTSNIMIDETMVTPSNGVYVTYCTYNGVRYPSVTNVGVKPTIGTYHKNVETHIFNFDKELYGKNIRVEFLEKTRDERKFESVEALSKQITDDCITARSYHRQRAGKKY
ncbi:bifunctional riboflavin kinase/FAD synthetase [Anaerovorax odorimutans]|uniref:Riboflavin biosynthesis protein n=1 Tax=Anaerovorax odorimutans TaxID=109327 RepID=A0ABT1RMZ3_9FIRM|nr:bifunctional riboflavin kinase/FAD synthetase [Anaerovorax odorimutans]MCQ4636548.1 bifunctional riboflavin kinase/FAD synthetase [Anaerovorax odorimutans]